MKTSIIKNKYIYILFWLIIWEIISCIISSKLILPSPIDVFFKLLELLTKKIFYLSIFNSFFKAFLGFFIGSFLGIIFAIFSKKYIIIYNLFLPIINTIKVIPVASFILIALFWIKSENLPILISTLMAIPIFYFNIFEGLKNINKKTLEMAKIYNISKLNIFKYIYVPYLSPILISSIILGFSMCFKASIASEVIALANNTIGGNLQNAKVLLESSEVFAWTIIIILISIFFEKILFNLNMYLKRKFIYDTN